ncbi:MAG: 23S rRNA (adenine(2503)-C(2))-methyltransferase RlmN [Planctomycetota bacterium]|nr:23S rRNA (adenine(2503)-C(2))-methyltransferase RlmN [Planctomycetota bacterium]
MKGTLLSLAPVATEELVASLGGRPFHARIARREVFERGVLDYAEMSALPAGLRELLTAELPILTAVEESRSVAQDGTTKLLLRYPDGATVETVHIPSRRPKRGATLCVSTQVGCPVGCPFCASGKLGLKRNLEAHEIVEQFLLGRAIGPVSRSVVMGIGEPLLNYAALSAALEIVHDELGLGARRITVSTVGFPERLRKIAPTRPPFQLAISLHTPDDEQRAELVPTMAGVPIAEILAAGDDWFERTGREITYEYVLLGGVNDTRGHATRLAERLRGRRATVNLIPYNPIEKDLYERPSREAVDRFHRGLTEAGIVATVRWSRGVEAEAACGQLRLRRTEG